MGGRAAPGREGERRARAGGARGHGAVQPRPGGSIIKLGVERSQLQPFGKKYYVGQIPVTRLRDVSRSGTAAPGLSRAWPQPRSSVTDNYCRADRAPVVGCFYHDNGSRYFTTTRNVAEISPAPCVYLQGCCNAPAYDIAVSDLYCRSTGAVRNGCAAENCSVDASTLFVVEADAPWPAAAAGIVQAAGVRV